MRYPIIAALLLSGCAAQPTYSPAPTVSSAVDTRQACVSHIAKVLAFSEVGEPILDRCLAGNAQQCGVFAVLLDRLQPQADAYASARCFEAGNAPLGMATATNATLPRFTKKLQRFNKKLGN